MKLVSRQTGLSPHTIRAWERRYGALSPDRSPTNRRLYSPEDVEKLSLLRRAVGAGHSISQIAALNVDALRQLVGEDRASKSEARLAHVPSREPLNPEDLLNQCLKMVLKMDPAGLETALNHASAAIGTRSMLERVILPLLTAIGEKWQIGEMRPAQEHLATAAIRSSLGRVLDSYQPGGRAPVIVVTTPSGQVHELGAMTVAVTAASEGWRVIYLGPNLPADEIAGATLVSGAVGVALSLVYPPDDSRLATDLLTLRKQVGPSTHILVGGRVASAYRLAIQQAGATELTDLRDLISELQRIRVGESPSQPNSQ